MFIRRTQTRRTADGKPYFSHRLVHTERLGHTVRQRTLLNLGRHFDIAQADWPLLCTRITDVLGGQAPLMADCPPAVEEEAQRIAAQLLARGAQASRPTGAAADIERVDVDSLRLVRPRSIGVEQLGLWALDQVGLPDLLARLGVNGALRTAAAGVIVGRMAHPASERETHRWLQQRSGLGELLGVDFETVGAMQLYRASDQLVKHRDAIETHLFDRALGLFDLQPTVTLYDLTNTYFEGEASEQPQAKRGHSKERRSDCPLLTLGLMLDASGFVRRSKVFAGNVREHRTLAGMLDALDAPAGALVVVDRGIATEAAISWLRENHYRYLVVSRERHRQFDADAAVSIQTQSQQTVHLHKVVATDPDEVRLYCYSEERAEKERGIVERFATRFEAALTKLNDGLSRPRAHKRVEQVWQRIGRLKARHTRVAAHYQINVTADETGNTAVAVTWTRRPQDGSMLTHPGVYCLRSSETDWDEDTHPPARPRQPRLFAGLVGANGRGGTGAVARAAVQGGATPAAAVGDGPGGDLGASTVGTLRRGGAHRRRLRNGLGPAAARDRRAAVVRGPGRGAVGTVRRRRPAVDRVGAGRPADVPGGGNRARGVRRRPADRVSGIGRPAG